MSITETITIMMPTLKYHSRQEKTITCEKLIKIPSVNDRSHLVYDHPLVLSLCWSYSSLKLYYIAFIFKKIAVFI
jgi:hypothetical protein